VDDPEDIGTEVLRLRLEGGALATSSIAFRSWARGGQRQHHIIDPRTGAPSSGNVIQATAWGPDGAEAEIRAKWALLAGPAALDLMPAVLFLDDGRVLVGIDGIDDRGARAAS